MSTQAISYASANIVSTNGKGAAFAINFPVKVRVELTKNKKISGKISPEMKKIALKTLAFFEYQKYGLEIKIENEIPSGLGKEEAESLALAFAIAGAISKEHGSINELKIEKSLSEQFLIIDKKILDKKILLEICISTNKKLRFDRLASSLYGGFAVTDNEERKILRRGDMEELFIKLQKVKPPKTKKEMENELSQAWNEALKGNLYAAMRMDSLILNRDVGKFIEKNTVALSYSPPYLAQLSRKSKSKIKTTDSRTKIIEKPSRIYKVTEFLGLKGKERIDWF